MNKLLALLLVLPVALAAQTIEVVSLSEIRIDGVNAGQLADVIQNHPRHRAAVQTKAVEWNLARDRQLAAERKAAQDGADATASKAKADADAAVAAANAARDAAAKAKAAAEALAAKECARVEAIVAALKAMDPKTLPPEVQVAMQTEAEKQRAALLAQKAALEATIEKLAP